MYIVIQKCLVKKFKKRLDVQQIVLYNVSIDHYIYKELF